MWKQLCFVPTSWAMRRTWCRQSSAVPYLFTEKERKQLWNQWITGKKCCCNKSEGQKIELHSVDFYFVYLNTQTRLQNTDQSHQGNPQLDLMFSGKWITPLTVLWSTTHQLPVKLSVYQPARQHQPNNAPTKTKIKERKGRRGSREESEENRLAKNNQVYLKEI